MDQEDGDYGLNLLLFDCAARLKHPDFYPQLLASIRAISDAVWPGIEWGDYTLDHFYNEYLQFFYANS